MGNMNSSFEPDPERDGPFYEKAYAVRVMIATSAKLASKLALEFTCVSSCMMKENDGKPAECCYYGDAGTTLGALGALRANIASLHALPANALVYRVNGIWVPLGEARS